MRLFLGLTFSLLAGTSWAQPFNVNAGYRVAHGFMDRLNEIIIAYNQNEPNVLRPMEPLHFLSGPAVGLGGRFGGLAINLGYSGLQGSTSSQLQQGSVPASSKLQVKYSDWHLGFTPFPEPGNTFAFGFSFAADYSQVRISRQPSAIDPELDRFNILSITPSAVFFIGLAPNLYVRLNPYYQYNVNKSEMSRIYTLLVPSAVIDPADEYLGKFDNLGVVMSLMFSFY